MAAALVLGRGKRMRPGCVRAVGSLAAIRSPLKAFTRVFALVPDCHTAGRYSRVWRRHFYGGLQAALPTVILPEAVDFEWARPAHSPPGSSSDRTTASERLWAQIRGANERTELDAVISYCFDSDIDPTLVRRTVELGVPWINFFCDSIYALDRVQELARITSLNWFPERAAVPQYRALGRPFLCRPYALNIGELPEAVCETASYRLGFVGAPTGNRVLRLAALALLGCWTEVRGEGWQPTPPTPVRAVLRRSRARRDRRAVGRLGERVVMRLLKPVVRGGARPLADDEVVPFLKRCRVVLGLNEGRDLQGVYRSYLKLRDIEFPGHGCCYLTQHNEDVEGAFDIGREVLTFRDASEAASLVRRCVRHPDEARAIGCAGRKRVQAEHGWAVRLMELAKAL